MSQADFVCAAVGVAERSAASPLEHDPAGLPVALSIFADRPRIRDLLRDDAQAAGFRVAEHGEVTALLSGDARPLGEVVLLDCPRPSGADLAALTRLDIRAKRSGAQLVVSTSVAALDEVFGCLDQSDPQILVDPTRGERVIALGRVLARLPRLRVCELSQDDRLVLLRLTEQVGQIATRLDGLDAPSPSAERSQAEGVFRFESPSLGFNAAPPVASASVYGFAPEVQRAETTGDRLVRTTRPALPDPRLVRQMIRQRQLRARYFDGELFADPAWDMLLDLTAARAEHARVSVTSLCIASGVPPTTALRWIAQMTSAGLLERIDDDCDRRRAFIALTDRAAESMARFFGEVGGAAPKAT